MNIETATLFDQLQPRSLDVAGGDLEAVLKSLKARGARVIGMVGSGNSGWRLTIIWPDRHPVMVARPPSPVRSLPQL